MLTQCPFCGFQLDRPLKNGVALCLHCNQIFESNLRNRLLAAGWCLRRFHWDWDRFSEHYKGDEKEALFIYSMVTTEGFTHDEVMQTLDKIGVDNFIKKLPDFDDK